MEMEPDQGGSTATEIISGKMKSCSPGVLIHLLWKLISLCKSWGWLNSSTWKELQMNVIRWLHLSLSPSDNPAGLFDTTSAAACVSSCEKYWQHCRQLVNSMHLLCYYRVSQKKGTHRMLLEPRYTDSITRNWQNDIYEYLKLNLSR